MPGQSRQTVSALELSALTYSDFLIAAAEEYGYGQTDSDGVPIPPTDMAELTRCRKAVSRGLRRFAVSNPVGWRFMRRSCSILLDPDGDGPLNVGDDPAKYRMPWWFNGNTIGEWTSTDQGYHVRVVDPAVLNEAKSAAFGQATGIPGIACFRKEEQDVPTGQRLGRWVVEFWPTPTDDVTVSIDCEAWLDGMGESGDVFVAGQPYDRACERCIIVEAAHDARKGSDRVAEAEQAFDRALQEALAFDGRKPAMIGRLSVVGDPGELEWPYRPGTITFQQTYTLE